jgi:hypothetical protein
MSPHFSGIDFAALGAFKCRRGTGEPERPRLTLADIARVLRARGAKAGVQGEQAEGGGETKRNASESEGAPAVSLSAKPLRELGLFPARWKCLCAQPMRNHGSSTGWHQLKRQKWEGTRINDLARDNTSYDEAYRIQIPAARPKFLDTYPLQTSCFSRTEAQIWTFRSRANWYSWQPFLLVVATF